jgi:hypothetical protein
VFSRIYIENHQGGPKYQKRLLDNFVATTQEYSRGHHAEAGHETLPGGAGRPHPQAAQPATVGNAHELTKSSSTAS